MKQTILGFLILLAVTAALTRSDEVLAQEGALHSAENDSYVAQGWTYLHTFDTTGGVYNLFIQAGYGDTVFFSRNRFGLINSEPYSVDGGRTIAGIIPTAPFPNYRNWLRNNPVVVITPDGRSGDGDSAVWLSHDMGKTFTRYPFHVDSFHFRLSESLGNAWLDPTDDGTIYMTYGSWNVLVYPHEFNVRYIVRSTDTGKTWHTLNLPEPDYDAEGLVNCQILMEVRQHGLWYCMVSDEVSWKLRWYRTTDNGENFAYWYGLSSPLGETPVVHGNSGIEQAGIGFPGEIRKFWGPAYYSRRGYVAWVDDPKNYTVHDWLDSLHPGRPDTLNWFSMNYYVPPTDPDRILMVVEQIYSPAGQIYDSIWWHYSVDGGRSFSTIVADSEMTRADTRVFFDQRDPHKLWLTVKRGDLSFLYSRLMPSSSSVVGNTATTAYEPRIVSLSRTRVSIEHLPVAVKRYKIIDLLGRSRCEEDVRLVQGTCEIDLPPILPSGSYFLSLEASDGRRLNLIPVLLGEK